MKASVPLEAAKITPAPTSGACVQALEGLSEQSVFARIAQAVGGVNVFCNLPVLPWQSRFHEGGTGYIDGIRPSDLSSPMMRGVDAYKRPFLAVRTESEDQYAKTLGVETFFQRYTTPGEPWTSGNHYDKHPIVSSIVDNESLEKLEQLAQGETLNLKTPYTDETIRKKLA